MAPENSRLSPPASSTVIPTAFAREGGSGRYRSATIYLSASLPKVPVNNLFRMLEVAYNLRSFRLFDGEIQIESLEDVYERIVSILARRVLDRARKGLYRGYIGEADDLPYVRGRIDAVGAMLNSMRGIPRIPCRYEEHTADLEDNRILLWTLHQVRRQALRQEKVRIELDRARRALAGTITSTAILAGRLCK